MIASENSSNEHCDAGCTEAIANLDATTLRQRFTDDGTITTRSPGITRPLENPTFRRQCRLKIVLWHTSERDDVQRGTTVGDENLHGDDSHDTINTLDAIAIELGQATRERAEAILAVDDQSRITGLDLGGFTHAISHRFDDDEQIHGDGDAEDRQTASDGTASNLLVDDWNGSNDAIHDTFSAISSTSCPFSRCRVVLAQFVVLGS